MKEEKIECMSCGKLIGIKDRKYLAHEKVFCNGSHLEYKACPSSGKSCTPPTVSWWYE
jgi:hypothetical protein